MKKLLETLYVTTPESYLFCRNENICVKIGGEEKASIPAVMLDGIVCFGEMTVSTPLIGFCAEHGITLTFLSSNGRFYSRICGPVSGNVLLRKRQYQALDDADFQMKFVQNLLVGKLLNEKNVLMRAARTQDVATSRTLREACQFISRYAAQLEECESVDQMRGVEGAAAKCYFAHFDDMISRNALFGLWSGADDRRATRSTRYYRLCIRCKHAIFKLRLKRRTWIRQQDGCIRFDQGGRRWRWTCWRSSARHCAIA